MMPMWTMTLGRLIFTEGKIAVPYRNITTAAVCLAVPLLVSALNMETVELISFC